MFHFVSRFPIDACYFCIAPTMAFFDGIKTRGTSEVQITFEQVS